MKARYLPCWLVALAGVSAGWAQPQGSSASSQTQSKDSSTDATQSIVSPLGMGTGATLAVTQKGTNVTAAIGRQIVNSPINFWQVGILGSLDKNGQQEVYSSSQSDAPGFKGKVGFGYSSMIRGWPDWQHSGGRFMLHAWCLDIVAAVGETLPAGHAPDLQKIESCSAAVEAANTAVDQFPPQDIGGGVNQQAKDSDTKVLKRLADVAKYLDQASHAHLPADVSQAIEGAGTSQVHLCEELKDNQKFFPVCTNSKGVADTKKKYPALAKAFPINGEPSEFQWKAWASWVPNVTSAAYRPLVGGVYDLSSKKNWTKLLNAAVGDVALYYGPVAFGVEGGYGKTVKITTQNVCNNTVNGTYTAQQCDTAMLGEPKPTNAWLASATLQVTPIPILGKGVPLTPGAEVTFSYTAPTSGGHFSELAVPIYLAPATSPLSFVFGLQPTWDWSTDPKVGNKLYVSLFVGARPAVPAPVTK